MEDHYYVTDVLVRKIGTHPRTGRDLEHRTTKVDATLHAARFRGWKSTSAKVAGGRRVILVRAPAEAHAVLLATPGVEPLWQLAQGDVLPSLPTGGRR